MSGTTLVTIVNSLDNGKAEVPKQIKLFPLGLVKSLKGDFLVDTEAYNSILNHFKAHKVDIPVDYEHQTLQNVQAPAAGWIKELTLKSDGVYAAVEWTDKAAQYIKEKEYRYLSPVVSVREKDRKALLLHSVALTNTPAIDGMTAIVNSAKGDPAPVKVKDGTEETEPTEKTPPASSEPEAEDPAEFIKGLREMLQLPEDAPFSDIENRISELMQSTAALKLEVNSLHFEAHKQQADEVVTMALKSGKIMPYQKDWAFRSAMSSLEDFSAWVKDAPQVVPMGEIAFESLTLKEAAPRSRAHELMGLSSEDVKQYGGKPL
jgi:phage I-like protein